MKKRAMTKSEIEEYIKKLRPILIEELQAEAIRNYSFQFSLKNKKVVTKEEINIFIGYLVSDGEIVKEANEIIEEIITMMNRKERRDILKILSNSAFALSIINLACWYLAYYFKIAKQELAYAPINVINAILSIVFVIVAYTLTIFKKSE